MREEDWNDCIINNIAIKVSPNNQRAKALVETSKERIEQITKITKKNSNFVFEDYYTSIIELLQAKAFQEGYNIINHICLGFYLRDHLRRQDLYVIYDDLRYKRNALTYYGSRMDYETAKEAIEKSIVLMVELNQNLRK